MEKSPLEKFIDQMSEIMNLTAAGAAKPKGEITPEIEEKLKKLEESVEALRKMNEQLFAGLGFTDEQIKADLEKGEGLSDKDRRMIEYTKRLREDFEKMRRDISVKASVAKKQEKREGKKKSARQKRFRPLGGREDWKPL